MARILRTRLCICYVTRDRFADSRQRIACIVRFRLVIKYETQMEPGYIRPRLRASLPFTLDHGIFSRIDIGVKIRQRYEKKKKRKKKWWANFMDTWRYRFRNRIIMRFANQVNYEKYIYIFNEKVNSDVMLIYQYHENVL